MPKQSSEHRETNEEPEAFFEPGRSSLSDYALSETGATILICPYFLLISRKLKFSLGEFLIFTTCLGISIGSAISGASVKNFSSYETAILLYAVLHMHSIAFCASLYNIFRQENAKVFRSSRALIVAVFQSPPVVLCLAVGGSWAKWWF